MPRKKPGRSRTVLFVICSEELKDRVKRAARFTDRDLSKYVIHAVKKQLESDESAMRRRGK
jgi:hypothetical protein